MQKEISQILCELINIPSYGHIDNDHAILRYLKENLSQCLEIIDVVGENGNTNLLVGINTSLSNVKNCLLLSGHIDTVMPSKQHTPVATIQNCNIKGLGATDMKAFFASVIYKLPNLLQNKQPIIFAITTDEEDDFYGIDALTAEIKNATLNQVLQLLESQQPPTFLLQTEAIRFL